ncbi:MAG: hypothetical protein K2X82_08240 [Gemmataceae bacterium]|nr:hypothetical protein [Gemmataceae bacterium]
MSKLSRPSGFWEFVPLDGKPKGGETRRCVHCSYTWVYRPGSGILRGYCSRCDGFTCGSAACDACVPYEARLENLEAGRPELAAPKILAAVSGLPVELYVPPAFD